MVEASISAIDRRSWDKSWSEDGENHDDAEKKAEETPTATVTRTMFFYPVSITNGP